MEQFPGRQEIQASVVPTSQARVIKTIYVVTLQVVYRVSVPEIADGTGPQIKEEIISKNFTGRFRSEGAQFIAIRKGAIIAFRTSDGASCLPNDDCNNVIVVPDGFRACRVIALSLSEKEAIECFEAAQRIEANPGVKDLETKDLERFAPRWKEMTQLLAMELERHPAFIVDLL